MSVFEEIFVCASEGKVEETGGLEKHHTFYSISIRQSRAAIIMSRSAGMLNSHATPAREN